MSGVSYTWHPSMAAGDRFDPSEIFFGGAPLDLAATYTVAANNFIAGVGDNSSVLTGATDKVTGPVDIDVLVDYVKILPQPLGAPAGGRIVTAP